MEHSEEWRRRAKCHRTSIEAFKDSLSDDQPEVKAWAEEQRSGSEVFYPPRDHVLYTPVADYAKAICNGKDFKAPCAVRIECLLYALRNNEEHGIFGGMSHRERNALLRKWRRRRPNLDLQASDDSLRADAQRMVDERGK